MKMYVTGEIDVKAEILWAIKSAMSHFSFRASSDIRGLFQNMFPDSAILRILHVAKILNMLWHCTIFQRETVTKDQRSRVFDSIF